MKIDVNITQKEERLSIIDVVSNRLLVNNVES